MAKQRRKVSYKKKDSKAKRKRQERAAAAAAEQGVSLALDPSDVSAPEVRPSDRQTYLRFLAVSLGLAVAVGLAVAGWRFGLSTVGDPPMRALLLASGLGLSAFLGTSVLMRDTPGRRLLGVVVGCMLAAAPLLARAVADRNVLDSQVVFDSVLDGASLSSADASAGFTLRQEENLLDRAERPRPEGASDTWQAWVQEDSNLSPRTYGAYEKGLVVAWSPGPGFAVHASQLVMPDDMRAGSAGEVRWVALVQEELASAGGPRVDVRILDLIDGRLLSTATREQASGAVLSTQLAGLITEAVCPAYPNSSVCR